MTFSYVGEAEAPQGRADVIDAKGPDNFTIRLFVSQQTHLPIMVSWQGRRPAAVAPAVRCRRAGHRPPAGVRRPPVSRPPRTACGRTLRTAGANAAHRLRANAVRLQQANPRGVPHPRPSAVLLLLVRRRRRDATGAR